MAGPSTPYGVEAVRIGRLTADGTPDFNNPVGGLMFCGGVSSFKWDWEVNTGQDTYVEDARGRPCVIRKRPDLPKRITWELVFCRDDYRIAEIMGLATAITNGGVTQGRAWQIAQGCATPSTFYGVSLELWSEQWDCDTQLAGTPYRRTVVGRAYPSPSGSTYENGPSTMTYKGFAVVNNNFGDGPWGDLDLLVGQTNWPIAEIDNTVVPACVSPVAYINIPGSAS